VLEFSDVYIYIRLKIKPNSVRIRYIYIYPKHAKCLKYCKMFAFYFGERKLIILMILISDEDILTGMNQKIQDWII
jgi:hypothetical protein